MKDSERIQKLAAKLAGRKDGRDIVRKMKCGGKMYPGGGKFFRTNLQNESPLMYEPMITIDYPIVSPLRFRPQPDLGDYCAPVSTGMMADYPITIPDRAPVVVRDEAPVPIVVEAPVENLFSDEMIARRALKQRYAESAFNDKAKSKAGAQGAWQIMPITLKDYLGRGRGKSGDLNDPEYNRKVRDWVMGIIPRDLQEFWSDSDTDRAKLAKLYAAYNWGAGNLRKFLRKKQKAGVDISNPDNWVDDLNPETRRYVKYLAFDEDIPDSTVYTNAAFEKAAAERGYANGGNLFRTGGPEKSGLIQKAVRRYLFGNKTDDEARKALYDNLYPYGYGEVDMFESLARAKSAASGERDPRWAIYDGDGTIDEIGVDDGRYYGGRDDIFATYLGIPEKDRHKSFRDRLAKVSESEYHPTKGMEDNKYYRISITDEDKDELVHSGLKTPIGESRVSSSLGHYFGDHTVSHGLDKNGEYISYYDNWDINPLYGRHSVNKEKNVHIGYLPTISKTDLRYDGETFLEGLLNGDIKFYRSNTPIHFNLPNPFVSQKGDTGDMSLGIGKPVNFYDRLYLDDYYGVDSRPQNPDEFYGGYIIPTIITAIKEAKGGKIHIKPENRGKFNALLKRTGKSASWFKAHGTPAQKKMAVFALNARKWKHGDGGFINKYDGETESTGLMQRTPNWVVRGQDYSEWKPSDIQDIINWGYTDPEAFFGQEGKSTRDALSKAGMADSVIGDIYRNAPVELQAQLGDRYMGTAQRQDEYNQGIRDYTNYVAPRLGAAMAGSLLGAEGLSVAAPWLVDVAAPAIQRAANSTIGRRIRGGLDVAGTIDGIRNSLSDNGLRKTYRLLGEGNYGRAALSALGDAFDVAGGVGYLKGVGKRGAEAILRMGDAARSSGSLLREALGDANYLGKTGLKKYIHVPKYIKSQRDKWGHTSRQLLDRNTLEYIFNPMANPELAYKMPYNYSGDNTDPLQKGRHKYDRIDEFLGKTQPENVEYVNVEDLPANIREWAEDRYPGMKQIRVAHIGKTTDRVSHIDREIRSMKPGDTIENLRRSSTGLPDEAGIDMLDPGHHGVDLVADEDGTIRAFGNDVYKYNEKDWLKKWKNDFDGKVKKDGEVDKPKTFLQEYLDKEYGEGYSDMSPIGKLKYHGLRFIDRQGSPIIYNWDYGTVGHVPSYNMNPSTYVSGGAPDIDSTIGEIDDWIAKKKKAMMFTSDIDELDALSKDVKHGEMLKKMKEPVTPTSPYENYWADSDLDDVDFDIPDMSTFKSPEVDSEIGTFTDWLEADAAKEAAKEAAAQKHQDALDKLNDTSWINFDEINNPKPKATQAKKTVKKMTDEEVKALQDEITKQVKETYEKMKASKAKKTSSYNPAPHSNGTNPEDAELPWAYGGLLNRMSKFYNNDRSSMLNLVRKVKAGKN